MPMIGNDTFVPNLFVLGAAKCGTTTLHSYLRDMPGVCMSNPKEPFFFEAEFDQGLDYYRNRYFAHWRGEPLIGDARHRNLYLPYVASRIATVNSTAKLVAIFRNPIERAYSHWWHWRSRGQECLSFEAAIKEDLHRIAQGKGIHSEKDVTWYASQLDADGAGPYRTYVDSGYYYEQLERYLERFRDTQLHVMLMEDLESDPEGEIRRLAHFLQIDDPFPTGFQQRHENPAADSRDFGSRNSGRSARRLLSGLLPRRAIRRFRRGPGRATTRPAIDAKVREILNQHYLRHNQKLSDWLGRELSHWR